LEVLQCDIKQLNSPKIKLGVVYRPPDIYQLQWFEEFETYMEKTSSENDQVVMMGDFNVDQHKDDRMKKIMNNYKFNQLIKESTCVTKDTSTLIDHTCMYVTNDYNYNAVGVIPLCISDHHHT
jgi:hypothetical protein